MRILSPEMFHMPSLFRLTRPALLGLTLVTALSNAAEPTVPAMLPRPLTLDAALAFALVHSPRLRRVSGRRLSGFSIPDSNFVFWQP
jgi:hypothetical protein